MVEEHRMYLGGLDFNDPRLWDLTQEPPRGPNMEDHQVWVVLQGPVGPHWEIRGTGLRFDPETNEW